MCSACVLYSCQPLSLCPCVHEHAEMPALEILHGIVLWMAAKIDERSRGARIHEKAWTPAAVEEVTRRTAVSRKLQVMLTGEYQGQVSTPTTRYFCNAARGECDCGVFQDGGVPCVHACAVILKEHGIRRGGPAVEDFIDQMYATRLWQDAYSQVMPVIIPDNLPPSAQACHPPLRTNVGAGRSHNRRIASLGEAPSSQASQPPRMRKPSVCTNCKGMGGQGHNKRTCKWTPSQLYEEAQE